MIKHYIICNLSYEWDDFYGESEPTIEHIPCNKEDAIKYFDKKFGDTSNLPDNKWKYNIKIYYF